MFPRNLLKRQKSTINFLLSLLKSDQNLIFVNSQKKLQISTLRGSRARHLKLCLTRTDLKAYTNQRVETKRMHVCVIDAVEELESARK
jgi:hypothetical protein